MTSLDLIDRKIVAALMADATQPIAQIADQVGLSQTPCWKRIQKLESTGVLTGRVALADPAKLGLGLTLLARLEIGGHRLAAFFDQARKVLRERLDVEAPGRHR